MSLQLIEGRDFNAGMASDSNGFIINEQMARQFGPGKGHVGYRFRLDSESTTEYQVLGIVKIIILSHYIRK